MDRWGSIATIGFSLECPRHPVILFLYLMQVQVLQAQGNVQLGRQEKAFSKFPWVKASDLYTSVI